MTIHHKKDGRTITITPVGRLDSTTGKDFQSAIEQIFTENFDRLIVDFTQVDCISSKGLRTLLSTYKQMNGREMELTNVNAAVREILRITGFLEMFSVK